MKDYYQILGIADTADEQEIKLAYRRLAKRWHPDVNAGAKGAEEKFKEIAEAYDILSDPVLRSNYDRKRSRQKYYTGDLSFMYASEKEEADARDPRRKAYSPEDLARARERHRTRVAAHIKRRKKILVGMVITFVAYIVAASLFENYIHSKKKDELNNTLGNASLNSNVLPGKNGEIQNLDSPYDTIFGKGIYIQASPNEIVVYNPVSDAIVCAVEVAPPHRTIRNEFIHANNAFHLTELPNGSFTIKIYTGTGWDKNKSIDHGKKIGGFSKDEEFFALDGKTFSLQKPTYEHKNTNTSDTIIVDPTKMNFQHITEDQFFFNGDTLR
ncbi:MAG: DnaJ domain-containing protein [Bacteroidetes bacterium]|nr:DnaJ domain-containing protein [Bacteroidota bacterium]